VVHATAFGDRFGSERSEGDDKGDEATPAGVAEGSEVRVW